VQSLDDLRIRTPRAYARLEVCAG